MSVEQNQGIYEPHPVRKPYMEIIIVSVAGMLVAWALYTLTTEVIAKPVRAAMPAITETIGDSKIPNHRKVIKSLKKETTDLYSSLSEILSRRQASTPKRNR